LKSTNTLKKAGWFHPWFGQIWRLDWICPYLTQPLVETTQEFSFSLLLFDLQVEMIVNSFSAWN